MGVYYDDSVNTWRDEETGQFVEKPDVKEIEKDELIEKAKQEVIRPPSKIEGKEEKPAFYQDEEGRWRTREDGIKIDGKEYKKRQFIPEKYKDVYEEYNEKIHNYNQIKEQADYEDVDFDDKLRDWYKMKKSYRAMEFYDDYYYDGTHIRDAHTDEIVEKDDVSAEVIELAEMGFLTIDMAERFDTYTEYKRQAVGS